MGLATVSEHEQRIRLYQPGKPILAEHVERPTVFFLFDRSFNQKPFSPIPPTS